MNTETHALTHLPCCTSTVVVWGAFYRQHLLAWLVSLGRGMGCVSEGNSPLDRSRQPGATGGFQCSRRQGGLGLAGHSKPSLFNSPCPGANKLTPWSGAPRACLPPCLATGRAVCLTGEPTAWQSPTRLLGTVLACAACVVTSRQQFGSFQRTHGDRRRMD